jgi:hypothetical protein
MPPESALVLFALAPAAMLFCTVATFRAAIAEQRNRDKRRRPFGSSGISI